MIFDKKILEDRFNVQVSTDRDKVQFSAVASWLDDGKPVGTINHSGTVVMATGCGKSKTAIIAGRHLSDAGHIKSILIVVPSQVLVNGWRKELLKWDHGLERDQNIVIECIQTAYKFGDKDNSKLQDRWELDPKTTLLIVDEIHTAISPEYRKVFKQDWGYVYGLTATVPKDKNAIEAVAPPLFEYNIDQAVEAGFVSPYKVYNLPVEFTRSEKARYSIFDKQLLEAQKTLRNYCYKHRINGGEFLLARTAKSSVKHDMHIIAKKFWTGMTMRRNVCKTADNKITKAIDIIGKFPDKKWICFMGDIKAAEKLNKKLNEKNIRSVRYHSGLSADDRSDALRSILDPACRVIVSVSSLDAGFDLPSLDGAIVASNDSVQLKIIQRIGRTVRKIMGKQAIIINLYVDKTQDKKWVESKLKNIPHEWIIRTSQII
tara:strand:- start:3933 stop:5225 length:1293 start_codon:yes stop_codon:yes gene_type:complete